MPKLKVTLSEIEQARQTLRDHFEPTPLLYNRWLSETLRAKVYLKLENMHVIGSFKIRGATYKVSRLKASERRKGVIAASAGNHGQGVAWGAAQYSTKATIFMPVNAPLMKIQQTRALGAEVILAGENYDEAYTIARKAEKKGAGIFVHPYEDAHVIAGQGTTGLEILEQLPDVDTIIGSMGGGGLMSGVGIAAKSIRPKTEIIGAQASGASSLVESIRAKRLVDTGRADTFADGIRVIHPSAAMLSLLKPVIDDVFTANDEAIAASVLTLVEKGKVVSEGSGALPLAVLEKYRKRWRGKKVVLIVSGGNIDVNVLSRIIDRGLSKAGRRIRLNVFVKDTPGSLARITAAIADLRANVLQAIHDRDTPGVGLNETSVEFTLETKGAQHSKEIVQVLENESIRVEVLH